MPDMFDIKITSKNKWIYWFIILNWNIYNIVQNN